jgi:hypothetical protein
VCALLLDAGSAWAAPVPSGLTPGSLRAGISADEPAPMCDPDGASVAAGEDIPEIDRGHFEALSCEAQMLMAGWRPDAPEFGEKALRVDDRESPPPRAPQLPRPRYEGAREFSVPFPERAEPLLVVGDVRDGLAPSRGHARGLFRPPVARA